jgi:hypothetical protein
MNSIYYLEEEVLGHLNSTQKVKSFIWKLMYKRVKNKMNSALINPVNIKKIISNKHFIEGLVYNAPLPTVYINRTASWYIGDDDAEYYLPLSIGFQNEKIRFEVVLIEGEIDLRNVSLDNTKEKREHNPMLLLKNLKVLELCFDLLLEHIHKVEKEQN